MTRPAQRRMKAVQRRTPGNRTVTHFRRKPYAKHKCALCGKVLHGTPRGSPHKVSHMTKSERRPSRPYGGQLCSACTVKVISMKAKLKFKVIDKKQVPLSMNNYVLGA